MSKRRKAPGRAGRGGHKPGGGVRQPTRTISSTPEKPRTRWRAWLASPVWQVISAVLAALGVTATVWVAIYIADREAEASRAVLDVRVTYRAEVEPNTWSLVFFASNRGPAVAERVRLGYVGINTICTRLTVAVGQTEAIDASQAEPAPEPTTGAECSGGLEVVEVRPAQPSDFPLIYFRPVVDEALVTTLSAYSATCPELYPGESTAVEVTFRLAPDLDAELRAALPVDSTASTTGAIARFYDIFRDFQVSGLEVSLGRYEYRAVAALG